MAPSHRLLVVDDDVRLARLVRDYFTREGFEVDVLHHGSEAVTTVLRTPPDLILLDLNLPRKDGREVLIEIKANPGLRRIPVLIIGSSVEPSSSELSGFESDDNGHSSVLHRPHRLARLQTLIESIREFWVEPALSPWHSSEVAEA